MSEDLFYMKETNKCNRAVRFFLCVTYAYGQYAWIVPLKDKKTITIDNSHQRVVDDSKHKANKIWVRQGSKFYNRSYKSWFHDNNMYSTDNERFVAVVAEIIYKKIKKSKI